MLKLFVLGTLTFFMIPESSRAAARTCKADLYFMVDGVKANHRSINHKAKCGTIVDVCRRRSRDQLKNKIKKFFISSAGQSEMAKFADKRACTLAGKTSGRAEVKLYAKGKGNQWCRTGAWFVKSAKANCKSGHYGKSCPRGYMLTTDYEAKSGIKIRTNKKCIKTVKPKCPRGARLYMRAAWKGYECFKYSNKK